ncbi:uncharacterized protein [Montipora capricornis]|uniref:uncharacterized protein isoform X1 n=1 Tax=Montipora capricornis TaxID=246305 RepID=UPI0035F13EBC
MGVKGIECLECITVFTEVASHLSGNLHLICSQAVQFSEFPIAGRRDLKGLLTSILQGTTIWCLTPCLCPAPQVGVRMNIQSISYQRIVEIQCTSNKRTFLSC